MNGKVTAPMVRARKGGPRLKMVTAYDTPTARIADRAGADLLLICNNWQAAWETARLLAKDTCLAPRGREAAARLNSLRQTLRVEPAGLPAVRAYFAR